MANSPNLGLPFWSEGQDLPNVTHNEALLILDILTQGRVIDRDLTADPVSPSEGDAYIVASVATGLWVGQEDSIAYFFGGIWKFIPPQSGWKIWIIDEALEVNFDGSDWVFGGVGSGITLLQVKVDAAGIILLQTSNVGATCSVAKPGSGLYDLTFSGIVSSNVAILASKNEGAQFGKGAWIEKITDKTVATGSGTPTGCRIQISALDQFSCSSCLILETKGEDAGFTIIVKEMN